MITPGEIQKIANKNKVRDKQIEKDYVLTWVLYGLSQEKFLRDNLAFKGGTALKKCYFEDYRFSEDLDFTLIDNNIEVDTILKHFEELFSFVKQKSNITLVKKEHELNKHGDLTFYVDYAGPLQASLGSRNLKIDITYNETILYETNSLTVFNSYSDSLKNSSDIQVYSLEEIFIEKLCALIGRTQPRDLYDLWHLLENTDLKIDELRFDFLKKAESKDIANPDIKATLSKKEKTFKKMWEKLLSHQIHDLPFFDEIVRDLNKYFRSSKFIEKST